MKSLGRRSSEEEKNQWKRNSNENCYNNLHNFSLKNIISLILFVIILFKFILPVFPFFWLLTSDEHDRKLQNRTKNTNFHISYFSFTKNLTDLASANFDARVNMTTGKRFEINKTINENYAKKSIFSYSWKIVDVLKKKIRSRIIAWKSRSSSYYFLLQILRKFSPEKSKED